MNLSIFENHSYWWNNPQFWVLSTTIQMHFTHFRPIFPFTFSSSIPLWISIKHPMPSRLNRITVFIIAKSTYINRILFHWIQTIRSISLQFGHRISIETSNHFFHCSVATFPLSLSYSMPHASLNLINDSTKTLVCLASYSQN